MPLAGGDAARRGRHRRADAGLDARHLLRVHLGACSSRGRHKYLFTPLGLAVVFAMLASYGLSRTLTPITIGLLLKGEQHGEPATRSAAGSAASMPPSSAASSACAQGYVAAAHARCSQRKFIVPVIAVLVLALGAAMFMFVGRDFFPHIDGGQIQLHVRAPAGTRIETTERIFQAVEDKIREVIPERTAS